MSRLIPVARGIALREEEIEERFARASGPGGQKVQKVETAVQLRFDAARSPSLPEPVRARLLRLAGHRLTAEGILVIAADRFRSRERNRADARARLLALIAEAAEPPPPPRRLTRPSKGSIERRLAGKARRGALKRLRGAPED
jgi:ribosome-associated protein